MSRFADLSIQQKLVVLLMSTSLAGLVMIGIALSVYEWKTFRIEMTETLSSLAEIIGTNSTAALTFGDRRAAEDTINALRAESDIIVGCLYSADGAIFAQYQHPRARRACPKTAPEHDGPTFEAGRLIFVTGVILDKERIGSVMLRSDLQGLYRRLFVFIGTLFALITAVSVFSYLLSLRAQRVISSPIRALAAIVKRISEEKDYTVRAKKSSEDEIGQLVDLFNEMLLRIQQRDASIQRSNEELKRAKVEAESASRIKSEFLDIAAHELRTPLAALTLLVSSLQRQHGVTSKQRDEMQNRIGVQVDRLVRLVDELLNVSRLERGGFAISREPVDMATLISEAVDVFRNRALSRKFTFAKPSQSLLVSADPVRMIQVIGNLLDNAVKYSPAEAPVDVEASVTEQRMVRVTIRDYGKGIPKEQQAQLFERFHRLGSDETIRQSGLGLGLYISRKIVELHGGRIGVESKLGSGSSFFFEIPLKME
jgi:signal transduction histidine kinase